MTETFDLPVKHEGQLLQFPSRLVTLGYTHKFEVEINGITIFFEPDEERTYRAITGAGLPPGNMDIFLLQAIAKSIEDLLK